MEEYQKKLRRNFIEETIRWYASKYPQRYKAWLDHIKEVRDSRANVFGSDQEMDMRFFTSIPGDLFNVFERTLDNPKFLVDKDELSWFAKNFKKLVTFEKY